MQPVKRPAGLLEVLIKERIVKNKVDKQKSVCYYCQALKKECDETDLEN